jgi:hypothetical protein
MQDSTERKVSSIEKRTEFSVFRGMYEGSSLIVKESMPNLMKRGVIIKSFTKFW